MSSVRVLTATIDSPAEFCARAPGATASALRSRDLHVAFEILQGLATLRAGAALFGGDGLIEAVTTATRGVAREILAEHRVVASALAGEKRTAFGAALLRDAAELDRGIAADQLPLRDLIERTKQAMIGLMAAQIA